MIQQEVAKHSNEDEHDANMLAEFLWTSQKRHPVVNDLEFCSVLNAVIRDDIAEEIEAAAPIFRSLNALRVHRSHSFGGDARNVTYPPKRHLWRGTGFDDKFRPFFEGMLGEEYRVPGYLSASADREVALEFASKTRGRWCALWHIWFDRRGEDEDFFLVRHMSMVVYTTTTHEKEYLFAPYSMFTLGNKGIKWSSDPRKPHEIDIQASIENLDEDKRGIENVPLAPWY